MYANCTHSCSFLLQRGFSEFYRSSIDCRALVAVSISDSVQICQAPSRSRLFIPNITMVALSNHSWSILRQFAVLCICYAQSMDRDNPWIVPRKPRIRASRINPRIGCAIRGLHPTKCAKLGLAANPRIAQPIPRSAWYRQISRGLTRESRHWSLLRR